VSCLCIGIVNVNSSSDCRCFIVLYVVIMYIGVLEIDVKENRYQVEDVVHCLCIRCIIRYA